MINLKEKKNSIIKYATHLFTHADLHDGIIDESFFKVTVFLLFEPLNVHPSVLHKLPANKAHADFRSHAVLHEELSLSRI